MSNDNPLSPTEDGEKVNQATSKHVALALRKERIVLNKKDKTIWVREGVSATEVYTWLDENMNSQLNITDENFYYIHSIFLTDDICYRALQTHNGWTINGQTEYPPASTISAAKRTLSIHFNLG